MSEEESISDESRPTLKKQVTKREKSGCITCRIRRVKCDENKPACQRCIDANRQCEGYSILPFSRQDFLIARSHSRRQSSKTSSDRDSQSPSGNVSDALSGLNMTSPGIAHLVNNPDFSPILQGRYLAFFRSRTLPESNFFLDCRFWDRVIPEACRRDSAVKALAVGIGALHIRDCYDVDGKARVAQLDFADAQYQQALSETSRRIQGGGAARYEHILLICLLFIMYASLRGDTAAGHLHLLHGRRITLEYADSRQSRKYKSAAMEEILTLLGRLEIAHLSAASLGWGLYPYDLGQPAPAVTLRAPTNHFDRVVDARSMLFVLIRKYMTNKVRLETANKVADFVTIKSGVKDEASLLSQLAIWQSDYHAMVKSHETTISPPLLILHMWALTSLIAFKLGALGRETRFDTALEQFTLVCDLAEKVLNQAKGEMSSPPSIISLDVGCIPSLFYVATKCRDHGIRSRAIRMLRSSHRKEGPSDSLEAAAIATRWMNIEEKGLGTIEKASDISENCRVRRIDVIGERGQFSIRLRVAMAPGDDVLYEGHSWEEDLPVITSRTHYLTRLMAEDDV